MPLSPHESPSPEGTWADRLSSLARELRGDLSAEREKAILSELWLLISTRLSRHLQAQCRRLGWVEPEDLEDLVSEKALDLLRRIDSHDWDPVSTSPGETISFFVSVARNGLIDHHRKQSRLRARRERTKEVIVQRIAAQAPDTAVDHKAFSSALVDCAAKLRPRHRLVWIFRTFYDMPSREIAHHPNVETTPGNVDVILGRCRSRLKTCLEAKGFHASNLAPGCYAAVWCAFFLDHPSAEEKSDV